jgi:hypothetical protein
MTEAPKMRKFTLDYDIIVAGEVAHTAGTEITVRKPMAGELRGLSLSALGTGDVSALEQLAPRITGCCRHGPGRPDAVRKRGDRFFAAEGRESGLPDRIEDPMADLALVFHWGPPVMDPMEVGDLMGWRQRAAIRHNPQE